jgi:Xaa-Pro aminopeptidase
MNHFKQDSQLSAMSRKPQGQRASSILFHAEATDPDMLYFSRFQAFDPYLAFTVDGRRFAVINAGEFGRMAKESAFDEILLLNEVQDGTAKRFKLPKGKQPELHQLVLHLAELHGIPTFRVSSRFPVGLARKLREAGMILEIADDRGLFPERQIKTAAEVEALRKGNKASEAGFRVVTKTLAESKIRNGKLVHDGKILTAERRSTRAPWHCTPSPPRETRLWTITVSATDRCARAS